MMRVGIRPCPIPGVVFRQSGGFQVRLAALIRSPQISGGMENVGAAPLSLLQESRFGKLEQVGAGGLGGDLVGAFVARHGVAVARVA